MFGGDCRGLASACWLDRSQWGSAHIKPGFVTAIVFAQCRKCSGCHTKKPLPPIAEGAFLLRGDRPSYPRRPLVKSLSMEKPAPSLIL